MSDRAELFRSEALAHRARPEGGGAVLRTSSLWASRAFWALLVLVGVALGLASQLQVERSVAGSPATDPRGRVVVLVPASEGREVGTGDPVRIGTSRARVISLAPVVSGSEISDRFGVEMEGPAIPLLTDARTASGTARVVVGSDPILVALVPGLSGLLGSD